jgi:hypothetical protein
MTKSALVSAVAVLACVFASGCQKDEGESGNTDVDYTDMNDDMPAAGNQDGTPGGGSGGAIYNDGNTMTLSLCGVRIEYNEVNAYGAAIFFVSNNHDGTIVIEDSVIRNNINHSGSTWEILPGISGHDDTTLIVDDDSIIE